MRRKTLFISKKSFLAITLTISVLLSLITAGTVYVTASSSDVIYSGSTIGGWSNDAIGTRTVETIAGDPRFDSALVFNVTDMMNGYFCIGSSLDGTTANTANVTSAYDTGTIRFWVKSESVGSKFSINLENGDPWGMSGPQTITIEKNNIWQEVQIPLTSFSNPEKYTAVANIRVWASGLTADETFGAGESFKIAGFKIYSGVPDDMSQYNEDTSSKVIYSGSTIGGWSNDAIGTRTVETITGDPRFDSALVFNVTDMMNGYFCIGSSLDGTTANTANVTSVYNTGTVRFWVKSASVGKKFSINLENGDPWGMSGPQTITIENKNVWQEVQIPLTSFSNPEKYTAVGNIRVWGSGLAADETFGAGESFKIAGFKIYSGAPEDMSQYNEDTTSKVIYSGSTIGGWSNDAIGTRTNESISSDPRFDSALVFNVTDMMNGYFCIGSSLDGTTANTANVTAAYETGTIRFWVKSASVGKKFSINLENGDPWGMSGPQTITIEKNNVWQEVQIPLTSFSNPEKYTAVGNIRVWASGLTADQTFGTGESFKIAGFKIYSGAPEDMSQYNNVATEDVIYSGSDLGGWSNSANTGIMTKRDIANDPRFENCFLFTVSNMNDGYFGIGSSLNGVTSNKANVAAVKDSGYVRFWVKSASTGRKFVLNLEDDVTWGLSNPYTVQITTANTWQEVQIPLSALYKSAAGLTSVANIRIWGPDLAAADTFKNGEKFMIAGLKIYSGTPEDMSAYANLNSDIVSVESKVVLSAPFISNGWGGGNPGPVSRTRIENDPRFNFCYVFHAADLNGENSCHCFSSSLNGYAYNTADLNECVDTGYVRLWVKSAYTGKKFTINLEGAGSGWFLTQPYAVTITEANKWQEVRIPLAYFKKEGRDMSKTGGFRIGGYNLTDDEVFAENQVFMVAGLSVYSGEPEDMSQYANLGNEQPPENDDGSYAEYNSSKILGVMDYSNAPFTNKENMGTIESTAISDLGTFNKAFKWTIGQDFIDKPGDGYLFWFNDTLDVSEYVNTGYLSFWVKSSVAPARFIYNLMDDTGTYGDSWYVTITQKDVWQEVRVRLCDLIPMGCIDSEYIGSLFIRNDYKWYQCGNSGLPAFSGSGYLNAGDTLMISGLRFTSDKPLRTDAVAPVVTPTASVTPTPTPTSVPSQSSEAGVTPSSNNSGENPQTGEQNSLIFVVSILVLAAGILITRRKHKQIV